MRGYEILASMRVLYTFLIAGALLIGETAFAGPADSPICDPDLSSLYPKYDDALAFDIERILLGLNGYKSQADVDRYMECSKRSNALHQAYVDEYRALVIRAAEAADLPASLLTCLYFRESHWDKNAASPATPPAVGIAQFMPSSWAGMRAIVQETKTGFSNPNLPSEIMRDIKTDSPYYSDSKAIADFYNAKKQGNLVSDPGQLDTLRIRLNALKKRGGYPNPKTLNLYLTNVDTALEHLQIQKIYADYLKANGINRLDLGDNEHDGRKNATAAIILGAAYLKVHIYQGMFGHDYRYPTQDRLIMAAGGYNRGPGKMKCDSDMELEDCIATTTNAETRGHMIAIRNCSEKDNWDPMSDAERACPK
jgi:hypothetical protein